MRRELVLVRNRAVAHDVVRGRYRCWCGIALEHIHETSLFVCLREIPGRGCAEWIGDTAVARVFAVPVLVLGLLRQSFDRIE